MGNNEIHYANEYLFRRLKDLPEEKSKRIKNSKLLEYLHDYIDKREKDAKEADHWIMNNEKIERALSINGVNSRDIIKIVEVSLPKAEELKSNVEIKARTLVEKLENDIDNKYHCWMYLIDFEKKSNAWITATCMYSLFKTMTFLKLIGSNQAFIEKYSKTIDWFFREDVLINNKGRVGWSSVPFISEEKSDIQAKLHDTAYVLNILIKIAPNHFDRYVDIIKSIITWPSYKKDGWYSEADQNQFDIAGTAYCLRAISNFLKFCKNGENSESVTPILIEELKEIYDRTIYSLYQKQKSSAYWESNYGNLSNQATTALAIHALRSANCGRDWNIIDNACKWLVENLKFIDDKWCWATYNEQGKLEPNIFESSLCISALLRGSTFRRFVRAEAVILWLFKDMNHNTMNNQPYNISPALCAFSDYLRSFNEPGFFNYRNYDN